VIPTEQQLRDRLRSLPTNSKERGQLADELQKLIWFQESDQQARRQRAQDEQRER
jgi:hypothetical protein